MLSLITTIHWLGNILSLIIIWVAIAIIYNSHALWPLGLIGLTFVWMFGGSWLINDQPAGIGIREDRALITQDLSRFYPHIFVE